MILGGHEMLEFCRNGININFTVEDDGRVRQITLGKGGAEETSRFFVPSEVFISGENPNDHHGAKHTGSAVSDELKYVSHTKDENGLALTLKSGKIRVVQHYEFFDDIPVVRAYCEVENISEEALGLEYVSSVCLYGFDMDYVYLANNAWERELQWRRHTPEELGYDRITGFSTKRIAVSNTGTWPTKEYLPMGMIENSDGMIFWQIESGTSWNFEISDIGGVNYLKLSGASEQENGWWKSLAPGESFTSAKSAVCFADSFDEAVAAMTEYRRKIAYSNKSDEALPVIFNDYMGCLWADPTTERMIPVIDAAARLGAEIYCMDAGWYADGTWWETVGEWKVCEKRFSNGMGEVFDYIRSKDMRPGIWLEPEVMGISCPIADRFDDSCFFMRHGKRVIDHGRYHFDFRAKTVRDFLDGVVDGLIADYGICYFKFDYNIDGGVGTEIDADSFGDGLLKHRAAFLDWVDGIYRRHPEVTIENCASGGMRMDYETLSHFSLQSLSDAEDYKPTAVIAAMSQTAVIPEQSAVWCLPKKAHSPGEVAFNIVNTMLRRMYISGETHLLSNNSFELLREGVELYKSLRSEIPRLKPFYPMGIINFESEWVCSGFRGENYDYVCIGRFEGKDSAEINIGRDIKDIKCIYPLSAPVKAEACGDTARIFLGENSAVVLKLSC